MTTIGRVEFQAGIDGSKMPAQARAAGAKAGKAGGEAYSDGFTQGISRLGTDLDRSLGENGVEGAEKFLEAAERHLRSQKSRLRDELAGAFTIDGGLKDFLSGFDDVDEGVDKVRKSLDLFNREGEISSTMLDRYNNELDGVARSLRLQAQAAERAADRNGKLGDEQARLAERNEELQRTFRELRQVVSSGEMFSLYTQQVGGSENATKRFTAELQKLADAGNNSELELRQLAKRFDDLSDAPGIAAGLADIRREEKRMAVETKTLNARLRELYDMVSSPESFTIYARQAGSAEEASRRFGASLDDLRQKGAATDIDFLKLTSRFEGLSASIGGGDESVKKFTDSVDSAGPKLGKFGGILRRMDGDVLAVVAALLLAAPQVAVLGSAVGSSITLMVGALGALAVGVGLAALSFTGFDRDLEDIPEGLHAAKESIDAFKEAMTGLRDAFATAFWDNFIDAFNLLQTDVLPALTTSLESFAATTGTALSGLITELASPEGLKAMQDFFSSLEGMIPGLVAGFGDLIEAVTDIFTVGAPFLKAFADGFADLMGQFSEWTSSVEGQNALEEWFTNGKTVMDAFLPLVAAVGEALADLITPETVQMTVDFLTGLTDFMPYLSDMLAIFGEIDVLGIFVDTLNLIGEAMAPLSPLFHEYAGLIGELAAAFLEAGVAILASLLPALEPLLQAIVEAAPKFIPLVEQFGEMAALVGGALADAFIQLLPSIIELSELFMSELLPPLLDIAQAALPPLIEAFISFLGAITPFIPILVELISVGMKPLLLALELILPYVPTLMDAFINLFNRAIVPLIGFLEELLGPLAEDKDAMDDIKGAIEDAGDMFETFADVVRIGESVVRPLIDGMIGLFGALIGPIEGAIGAVQGLLGLQAQASAWKAPGGSDFLGGGGAAGGAGGNARPTADGSIVRSARYYIGEAGAEMIVPLARPLSQVNPEVRAVSAFAQGKGGYGESGSGKVVNIAEGAIQITTVNPNGEQVASALLDRLAENLD